MSSFALSLSSIVLIIIYCLGRADAVSFGVSPDRLVFNMDINNEECRTLSIFAEQEDVFIYEEGLNAEGILETNFPSLIRGKDYVSLCLKGKKSGNYTGLFVLGPAGKNVEVGIKTTVNVRGYSQKAPQLSGAIVLSNEQFNQNKQDYQIIILFEIVFIALCVTCILLAFRMRRKKADY